MTKAEIIKHGVVVKWYCDNAENGVWHKGHNCSTWVLTHTPQFYVESKYVQNDAYAEVRKALSDGKEIQRLIDGEWETCDILSTRISPSEYRVKPKFTMGQWYMFWDKGEGQAMVAKYGTKELLYGTEFEFTEGFGGDNIVPIRITT